MTKERQIQTLSEDRVQELKDMVVDLWFDTCSEEDLENMYRDKKMELLDLYSKEELVELFDSMGMLDEDIDG